MNRDYRDVMIRLDAADALLLAKVRAKLERESNGMQVVHSTDVLRMGLHEMGKKMGIK